MYIPGRFRTGSNPSRTVICLAPYPAFDFAVLLLAFLAGFLDLISFFVVFLLFVFFGINSIYHVF